MSNEFRYKPSGEKGHANYNKLVILIPTQYRGDVGSVELVGPDGKVIEKGRFRHDNKNGNRPTFDFTNHGSRYPAGTTVRMSTKSGSTVNFNPSDGLKATEQGPGGSASSGALGSGGGSSSGGMVTQDGIRYMLGAGGQMVAIPEFVDFNPEDFYLDLEQAFSTMERVSDRNTDRFGTNFNIGGLLAQQNLNTELAGLESFLPRSTKLIRDADRQGNQDIIEYGDLFDSRNADAAQRATATNVATRQSIVNDTLPGTFERMRGVSERLEGDVSRIRERESEPLIDPVLMDVAARSARNAGADRATAGGFGVESAATRNLLDAFDFDSRLKIEQTNRDEARKGDQAINLGETAILNAETTAQNAFNSLIAPGIQDTQALQLQPNVTNIGGQISATPTTDAASIQRNINESLTPLTTISPTTGMEADFRVQQHNRNMDLEALRFEQEMYNTIAGAANMSSDIIRGDEIRQEQIDMFNAALEQRRRSEDRQGLTSIVTTGIGLLGPLVTDWLRGGKSDDSKGSLITQIVNSIGGIGKDAYNGLSSWLNSNFGIDMGSLGVDSNTFNWSDGTSTDLTLPDFDWGASVSTSTDSLNLDSALSLDSATKSKRLMLDSVPPSVLEGEGDYKFVLDDYRNMPPEQFSNAMKEMGAFAEKLKDPDYVSQLQEEARQMGISPGLVLQAGMTYANWDTMSDRDRAFSMAGIANTLASNLGAYDGVIPGAAISMLRQTANLVDGWDDMSDGKRAAAFTQMSGTMAAAYATLATKGAAGGPVGLAISLGAAAVARSTQVLIDRGFAGREEATIITNPVHSLARDMGDKFNVNPMNWAGISRNDQNNFLMMASPIAVAGIPVGPIMGVASMLGSDLDFTSGKSKDQKMRDAIRSHGQQTGFIGDDWKVQLADGKTFDIGKDGGAKLTNVGQNIDGKTTRSYSDVDWSNPIANDVVAMADPLTILAFRSPDAKPMVGHMFNALTATNPTDINTVKANGRTIALNAGINYASGIEGLKSMYDAGMFDEGTYNAYRKSWQNLMLG